MEITEDETSLTLVHGSDNTDASVQAVIELSGQQVTGPVGSICIDCKDVTVCIIDNTMYSIALINNILTARPLKSEFTDRGTIKMLTKLPTNLPTSHGGVYV